MRLLKWPLGEKRVLHALPAFARTYPNGAVHQSGLLPVGAWNFDKYVYVGAASDTSFFTEQFMFSNGGTASMGFQQPGDGRLCAF